MSQFYPANRDPAVGPRKRCCFLDVLTPFYRYPTYSSFSCCVFSFQMLPVIYRVIRTLYDTQFTHKMLPKTCGQLAPTRLTFSCLRLCPVPEPATHPQRYPNTRPSKIVLHHNVIAKPTFNSRGSSMGSWSTPQKIESYRGMGKQPWAAPAAPSIMSVFARQYHGDGRRYDGWLSTH